MKRKLLIVLAVILTLTLSLTSVAFAADVHFKVLPMEHRTCGSCGPSSGASIGQYYRDDYSKLPPDDYMCEDLWDYMGTYEHEGSTYSWDYGPGFTKMTRDAGYYNFDYVYDSDVTAEDYGVIKEAIDKGWPVALVSSKFEDDLGVVDEDFEWGNDGDSLDTSTDWTVYSFGESCVAEIDKAIMHSGTKSARFHGDGENTVRAYFALDEPSYIGSYIRKQDSASALVYNGNGSRCIYIRISDAERLEYGTPLYQDVCEFSANEWHRFELKNINWTEGTFDIYLDGFLEWEGAEMWEVQYLGDGEMNYNYPVASSAGTFWVDDILGEDIDNWPPKKGHYVAIKGYSYNSEATPPIYTIYCTDSLSNFDDLWLDWMNLGTDLRTITIKDEREDTIIEDFEWGTDGTSLSESLGWVTTWDAVTSAEIDTKWEHEGMRSGKWYWDGEHAAEASFTCAPLQSYGFWYRRDGGGLNVHRHGDETHRIDLGIFWDGEIKYWDTQWRDTGYSISDTYWHLLEIRNIDWTNHIFDIYLDEVRITPGGASMQAYGGSDGIMYFINAGSNNFWIDDIHRGPEATTLELSPEADNNPVYTTHELTATVYDQFDNVMEGVAVTWSISGVGSFFGTPESTTDADGQADAVITSSVLGTSTVRCEVTGNPSIYVTATNDWTYVEWTVIEDFEWGNDEDSLAIDGGDIGWIAVGIFDSVVEIDTAQKHSGTRSARFYRDWAFNPVALYPLYHPSYIGNYIRKDGNAQVNIYNGDETKRVLIRITYGEKLQYYDTAYHNVCSVSIDTWHLLELKNIDWNAGTFDIYLDGILRKEGAGMETSAYGDGYMCYSVGSSGPSEFWIDDILVY
jgi:hypothetical protein